MKNILVTYICLFFVVGFSQTETIPLENTIGEVSYESKDHRSNVYEVVSDRKTIDNNQFQGIIIAATDYYPYGSEIGARSFSGDYKYGFQGQEKDEEAKGKGNSIIYKYRMHDPRVGRFFAVDPLAINYPYYSPYQFSGNRLIDRIEYLGMKVDSTHADASMASAASYGGADEKFDPIGWNKSEKGEAARKVLQLDASKTGLKYQLYERENSDGKMEYMMAYAGTELNWNDIGADLKQVTGDSGQYEDAIKLSKLLVSWVGSENITFTGHSLGGGLAAVSSYATGSKAVTFNAAGVTGFTLHKIRELNYARFSISDIRKRGNITAYVVKGEVLDELQNSVLGLQAVGKIIYVDPIVPSSNKFSRHKMINLIRIPLMKVKIPTDLKPVDFEPNTDYQLKTDH